MNTKPVKTVFLCASFAALLGLCPAQAAALWAGADVRSNGFDLHAGTTTLPIPFLATAGLEAGLGRSSGDKGNNARFGVTMRDINIPFSKTDAFISGGAAYHTGAKDDDDNGLGLYVEGGFSGNLVGPLGWRAGVRSDSKSGLSAGIGVEAKF